MFDLLTLFVVSFFAVFILGFQSRNINTGQFKLAALCSFGIGLSQVYLWRTLTMEDASTVEAVVYSAAGACGILFAMWFHKRFVHKEKSNG